MVRSSESKSPESAKLIAAFGEDQIHQVVIDGLIWRISKEMNVEVRIVWRNIYGGYGRVVSEMKQYLRNVKDQAILPNVIVVVTDANCKGYNKRSKELSIGKNTIPPVVYAIPDPHVER